MLQKLTISICVFILFFTSNLNARDFRVGQIPNGIKFGCLNCHVNSEGGGGPTPFGEAAYNSLDVKSPFGNVQWGPALAAMDSDDDGIKNGDELLDPNGTWSIGQTNPGDLENVSNPGDPNSITVITSSDFLPNTFALKQNYPNPFNPTTTIVYQVAQPALIKLVIYDNNGREIITLVNAHQNIGEYRVIFNASDLPSGVFFYQLKTSSGFNQIKKMMILK